MSWRTASKLSWLRSLPAVSEDEPLASRTSFGIGGPADFFVEMSKPAAIEETIDGEVEGFMPGAGKTTWKPPDLKFEYRTSALRNGKLKGGLVVEATIQLERGDGEEAKAMMAKLTRERNETQPIKTKNCGSVFKNPPGDSAGRLVQAAGLKGAREGAAVVSSLHGNFIINEGGATAADVRRLIERVMAEVKRRFGIQLEPEVEMVGRWK